MTQIDNAQSENDDRVTMFFDIDNCLYKKSSKIHELMQVYIHRYFVTHLGLTDQHADMLHHRYYTEYGLALEGLVRHHNIDAMEYNKTVDDALPLEDILKPDPELRQMLERIDKSKVKKVWLFTNAYKTHGERVVRLLGIDDLFDGITYCNYNEIPLVCKPKKEAFDKVMKEAGESDPAKCVFVDDSGLNIRAATELGWSETVHYVDPHDKLPEKQAGHHVIRSILDLPTVVPHLFT